MHKNIRRLLALLPLLLFALTLSQAGPAMAGTSGIAKVSLGADSFPDVPLVTHEGKTVRFFSDLIKDKVVAISFMYTNCSDGCAMETARMRQAEQILRDRSGHDVFFYSITIDPAHDTPEVLMNYAQKFDVARGWVFLTGKEADLALLRKKLAGPVEDKEKGRSRFSYLIGNQRTGEWLRVSVSEDSYVVASKLGSWLPNWKMPQSVTREYMPKKEKMSKGESIFRTNCAACHNIGVPENIWGMGPDLAGVTERREQEWLVRWIGAPDEMIAESDWQAVELYNAFHHMPMPNLKLTQDEIEAVIGYIDAESHRVMHGGHQH